MTPSTVVQLSQLTYQYPGSSCLVLSFCRTRQRIPIPYELIVTGENNQLILLSHMNEHVSLSDITSALLYRKEDILRDKSFKIEIVDMRIKYIRNLQDLL